MLKPIQYLLEEMRRAEKAGAVSAAMAMAFVCIDAMTYLAMPAEKNKQDKADFIEWVDTYLKGDEEQSYQYAGSDVYGARCALLHAFGSEVDFHRKNPDTKIFGY